MGATLLCECHLVSNVATKAEVMRSPTHALVKFLHDARKIYVSVQAII